MNKVIVVSGAGKGIGKAIAERFGVGGFDVAICARTKSDLEVVKNEIEKAKKSTAKVFAYVCDVSKKEELKTFAEKVLAEFDRVDVLVNNAGTFIPGRVFDEPEGTLEKLIETNLYSAYHLSRFLLPSMIDKESGQIFNVCSVAGIQSYPNGGSYSISKFAMIGLSKALREELKPYNIKVTSLIPGATFTDSWANSGLPESRFMKVEDIAKTVWDIHHLSDNTVVEEIILRPIEGDI
jgi:short-subunit dehydrogenase